ncbi:hypothetical protein GUITHDRAFT_107199 [Guillardia theta CCMP2712]|uniref:PH domain-containing protein n=1 Tax=Guillardia theta (strain CCMP2712) TaxID=905079 RepID=L1JFD9_GUITC|nr:hypothetical protein GUITHDRAFT_107199 [Guillardia theta CCMP2712]EKX46844.1 hypothetical protein GUITHDRAFT_107199 [Guillardia theta CCMP2712]|eukprot:XP_005833824.1 hypothetical protein GUITHDRAFT_107199 [Guillardia theta CCMP2712]
MLSFFNDSEQAPLMMSCLEKLRPRKDLSKFFDLWQTRFFVLVDKQLKYFKRYENYSNGEEPLGEISLERAWLIEQESNSPSKKKVISIRTPWRDFTLRTDQERIFENWMKAFDSIGLVKCAKEEKRLKEEARKDLSDEDNVTWTNEMLSNSDHSQSNDRSHQDLSPHVQLQIHERENSSSSSSHEFNRSDDVISCSLYLANETEVRLDSTPQSLISSRDRATADGEGTIHVHPLNAAPSTPEGLSAGLKKSKIKDKAPLQQRMSYANFTKKVQ